MRRQPPVASGENPRLAIAKNGEAAPLHHGRVPGAGGVQRANDWSGGVAAGLPDVARRHDVHRAGLDVHRRTGRRRGEPHPRVGVEVHALEGDHAGPTWAATWTLS